MKTSPGLRSHFIGESPLKYFLDPGLGLIWPRETVPESILPETGLVLVAVNSVHSVPHCTCLGIFSTLLSVPPIRQSPLVNRAVITPHIICTGMSIHALSHPTKGASDNKRPDHCTSWWLARLHACPSLSLPIPSHYATSGVGWKMGLNYQVQQGNRLFFFFDPRLYNHQRRKGQVAKGRLSVEGE